MIKKSDLSSSRRNLVELMQDLNFGRIEHLQVIKGEPVLDTSIRVVREVKLGGDNGPRPERSAHDFALQSELVELCSLLDGIESGKILVLEVKHGKPFRFEMEE